MQGLIDAAEFLVFVIAMFITITMVGLMLGGGK